VTQSFAFLLSRQPRALAPDTWWFRAMNAAATWAVNQTMALVAGDAPFSQRTAARLVSRRGGDTRIIATPPGRGRSGWRERDRMTIAAADRLIGLSIRPGGIMEALALSALAEGKAVHLIQGETPPAIRDRLIEAGATILDIPIEPVTPRAAALPEAIPRAYDDEPSHLWHFTRSACGPWPGETEEQYIDALIKNAPGAGHTATDALARILEERRIRACGRLIKGSRPVVCLTAATPREIMAIRKYRPALLRWDFEPAAIGIPIDAAEALGIRPVRYLPPGAERTLAAGDRHLFQKHQPPEVDFSKELEWRVAGDLDLSGLRLEEMRVYLPE
jgi:hypothetical protein